MKLAPENKSYRLQFALALLRVEDAGKRKTAMSMLAELRTDEKQRAAATRALILDGIAHRDSGQKLAELAHELQGYPEATFSDRLLHLDILRQLRDPLFAQHLTEMEKTAASNPADLAAMLSWMSANGMSLLAIDFARTLPNDAVTKWPEGLEPVRFSSSRISFPCISGRWQAGGGGSRMDAGAETSWRSTPISGDAL